MKTSWIGILALGILVASLGGGCDDDTATGPVEDEFELTVVVRDPDGDPVEGLNVVVWNMSSELHDVLQDDLFRRRAATRIRFALDRDAVCDLVVDDLNGERVETLLESDSLAVGAHSVVAGSNIEYEAGVEVYFYQLTARDLDTGEEFFEDSRFMTAVHLDPQRLTSKPTDPDGAWTTRDLTYVPGLRETLPRMPIVDETGLETGSFALSDTVVVRVVDDEGRYLQKVETVGRTATQVDFTWDPLLLLPRVDRPTADISPPVAPLGAELPPAVTALLQNSPNPFN